LANFCLEDLRELGCEPSLLDLRELQLPLFDNDKIYGSAVVQMSGTAFLTQKASF
jgi:hypothetical protein